ncbi:MAG TPA: hypothetical protein VEZ40_09360 [Pyrinomonadaceae bacterium]|nr:hypothetical protein [Pyrinomonadaceae bacterium]
MSTHIKKLLARRFLLAIGLVLSMVAFSLVMVQPPKAGACPSSTIEYTYYTDASMTEVCGTRIITCYCGGGSSGCRTPYYTIDYSDC